MHYTVAYSNDTVMIFRIKLPRIQFSESKNRNNMCANRKMKKLFNVVILIPTPWLSPLTK